MSAIEVTQRKLTTHEAGEFSKQITRTPNIIGYLPKELRELKTTFVIEENGQAKGVLAYVEAETFIDLKLLFIKEEFRGQRLGSRLFEAFSRHVSKTSKPICTVTRNDVVIAMLKKAGFAETSVRELPLAYILHQASMTLSLHRIKEYFRKRITFRGENKFSYYVKLH